ncbi:MarR family transcriptional regulator [Clostridium sp.]|uniref:MarR family transcriptional regulator n=1 Tax=Clostridium sp. TaxID=1506 RepID=UPI002FC8B95C
MDTINLDKIADSLFNMVLELHKKTFNKDQLIKGICMPPSHVKVIFSLSHTTGSSSLSHLASTIGVSKPNLTPIIDKLIQDGFVNRYEDPNDRRILRVELTEKAKLLLELQTQKFKDMLSEKLSILTPDDLNSLEDSLSTVTTILSKLN